MESSSKSQTQGQSPKSSQETLEPEVSRALGRMGPAEAWLELSLKVAQAQDRDAEAQQVIEDAEYKGDLDDLEVLMSKYSPVEGISLFVKANPTFDLQTIQSANPVLVVEKVLNALLTSE